MAELAPGQVTKPGKRVPERVRAVVQVQRPAVVVQGADQAPHPQIQLICLINRE